ncbi:MAG: hypothetical protein ABJK67_18380 [Anderseniella sp.]
MIFDFFNQKFINLIAENKPERDAGAKPRALLLISRQKRNLAATRRGLN